MGRNEWRDEDEWPLSRARNRELFLAPRKGLSWRAPEAGSDSYRFDPSHPAPTCGGAQQQKCSTRAGWTAHALYGPA